MTTRAYPGWSDGSVTQLNVAFRSHQTRRWLWRVIGNDGAEVCRELIARPALVILLSAATAPACSSRRLMHHHHRLRAVYHNSDDSTDHRPNCTSLCTLNALRKSRIRALYIRVFYNYHINTKFALHKLKFFSMFHNKIMNC